uniref:Serine aminopeptidase S33 domain-containing protein n=1 Tax=Leersia perrieri TaxID=77586 RepID=A0A0D9XN15_9ORYZ
MSSSSRREEDGYEYSEDSVVNSRGMRLFTCSWKPPEAPRGVVCLCHGYAVECSVTMRGTGERLARAGYAVYGLDYEGHGHSDGLQGYVPDLDALVRDCDAFFSSVAASFPRRRFLLGESMGGAVALLLHRMRPDFWSGAILVAPMCKIAEEMRPHPVVVSVLKAMTSIIPTWRVVPTNDVIDLAYRLQQKRDEIRGNPLCYQGRPRLKTAYELLRVSLLIESTILPQVSLPFLIVHGADDRVTDPSVSDLLYRSAATPTQDKTFNLYPAMWHALTSGELPQNVDTVFRDIIQWLHQRTTIHGSADSITSQSAVPSETDNKAKHDDTSHCGKQTS